MDSDKRNEDVQITPADLLGGADHVEPLPGLTAPVPDSTEKYADRPVEEVSPTPIGQLVPLPVVAPAQPARLVWLRTLAGSPKARLGGAVVLFFILVSLLAPILAPSDPAEFVGLPHNPPSREHPLGTDPQGRDMLSRTIWGGRASLMVGFGTGLVTTLIAALLGVTAGYFRGRVDDLITLLMNLFLVLPGLPLLILLAAYLAPGTATVIGALAITGWAFNARIIRAQALSVREKEFINATIVGGESDSYIILRELLPNLINLIAGGFIGATVYGIGASTALAFLGLTSTDEISWGTNLFWAQNGGAMTLGAWWEFLPSGLCVALVAFALALINYGMDEVTNPRLRAERELNNVLKNAAQRRVRATPVVFSDD